MEIERKFLIRQLPEHLEQYPCLQIEQGYLCTNPVVRIRKQDDSYFLTYKSGSQWKIVFFPGHESAGFVGEKVGIILFADAHDRIGTQITLFDLEAWVLFQMFH